VIQILKVTGESLSPLFQEGDYVLIGKIPLFLRSLKSGDIIVFRHPHYDILIKRIESISPDTDEIYVLGAHPDSADSRRFGPIRRKDIVGKVLWHIKPSHEQHE
jgi:nickel-type superoxide dismutase maturation protease